MSDNLQLTPSVEIGQVKSWAETLVVNSKEAYEDAAVELRKTKTMRKQIVDFFAEPKAKSHEAWKSIVAREKFFTDKLDEIEAIAKSKMLQWMKAEEAKRQMEMLGLQKQADARAAEERKRMLANAKRNETRGNEVRAEEWKEKAAAVEAVPVFVQPTIPKAEGIQTRQVWTGEVVDMGSFLKAASENSLLHGYVYVDMTKLVRSFAGKSEIAGVKFYQETKLAAR